MMLGGVWISSANRHFRARYVLRHPWNGQESCSAANRYRFELPQCREREAQTLATLTGWRIEDIRTKMGLIPAAPAQPAKWWQTIWR